MIARQRRNGRWKLLLAVLLISIALLFWLEWLGSAQLQSQKEIPVSSPGTRAETGSKIDR
jgi:hypothetical protein